MEYRYYEIPAGSPVLALLGDKWVQNYGREIDYLHFHNHLEVDPYAAEVVRRIYRMCQNGFGCTVICRTLNEDEIPCPAKYVYGGTEELSAYYNLYGRQYQLLGVAVY